MEPPLRNLGIVSPEKSTRAPILASQAADAGLWDLALALLEPDPTFAVYDEGDGLLSLYANPVQPRTLARALCRLHLEGALLDVTPRWGVARACEVDLDAVAHATAPLELIHAPSATSDAPLDTVLAAPHAALAPATGRRFAVSLHEQHVVVYTRDRAVLEAFVREWLPEQIARQSSVGAGPAMLDTALDSVLAPLPPQVFRRVVLEEEPRFWWLDLDACLVDDDGEDLVVEPLRWVGGRDRPWRAGWSW